jgi:deoxyribonuclease V
MDPWPIDSTGLDAEQQRLAALQPPAWVPPAREWRAGGCFLAFARGEQGPGGPGDRGWAGAATVRVPGVSFDAEVVVPVVVGASYERGRLALREGSALVAAVARLPTPPDVLLVDATGRDHPRGAGLALHLGAVLGLPTVGVTHRPLMARGSWPPDEPGASTPLYLDGSVVGAWLRTRRGARPVAVHAAWRTDAPSAVAVVASCTLPSARTPEPLRRARVAARVARARGEGRIG